MAKYKNKTNGVLSFTIGEKALRMDHIIFPGEYAELPEGNSYIASIEAQKLIERVPADENDVELATVGNTVNRRTKRNRNKNNTNLKQA